jgi:tRNA threonylcarbamoyladenosine biosynthesis protein TsaB
VTCYLQAARTLTLLNILTLKFLLIETSTDVLSVAVSDHGYCVAYETYTDRSHTSHITVAVGAVMQRAQWAWSDLSAIVISTGPGSYTSLRVGYAAAKGLCLATGLPLIEVPTLAALARAAGASSDDKDTLYMAMIDARRMEVYQAGYDAAGHNIMLPEAAIYDQDVAKALALRYPHMVICGPGAHKIAPLLPQAKLRIEACDAMYLHPFAENAYRNRLFKTPQSATPFYLKPPNITLSKKTSP